MMRAIGWTAALIVVFSSSPASCEKLFSYFSESDDPPQTSVSISPCTGDEVAECISHSLSCEKTSGGDPEFTIFSGNVEKVASSLIIGTGGQAKAQLKLSGGSAIVDLAVNSVRVDSNDMDGGWIVTFGLGSIDAFFEALTDKSGEGASLIVAGKRFPLAPQAGDGNKLVDWKNACVALEGQSLGQSASAPVLDCEFNSRRYRSKLNRDESPTSYQELQFTEGAQIGKVNLTEYHGDKAAWTAKGDFACSNGVSICRLTFPLMLAGQIELPYETVSDGAVQMVVIPAFRQEVYQTEQYAVAQGRRYGGLVADLLGGFAPKDNEPITPYNVYSYADCAKFP
ncbi:hypothetical protein [Mesorhizobium sp. ISC15]|uniref:hypothetical protein n=1 Tax=Mesorhizobium sp. ISC15 TaxID=3076429 RepID=UPI00301DD8AA